MGVQSPTEIKPPADCRGAVFGIEERQRKGTNGKESKKSGMAVGVCIIVWQYDRMCTGEII